MGLFDRMLPATDHGEQIAGITNSVNATTAAMQQHRQSRALQEVGDTMVERKRHSHTKRKLTQANTINEELQKENERLKGDNERLQKDNEQVRAVAMNIAVDRRALWNTIAYLSKKWGTPAETDEELRAHQAAEKERLENDPQYMNKTAHDLDQVAKNWTRAKKSPSA